MYWKYVLEEVVKKDNSKFKFTNISHRQEGCSKKKSLRGKERRKYMKNYWLGEKYPGIYFTRREAECMVYVLKRKRISDIGALLKLSPRTIEFYLKQMKSKLRCRTRAELIEKLLDSDFIKSVDFEVK